jgi:hypothetical protein
MKKLGLIIALFLLFSAVSDGAVPDDKEFRIGLKSFNSKNYKAAVTQLQEYVNKKPDPTAYYLIGYSLYKLGKFSEADEYFSQAYLIDPEFSPEKVGLIEKTSGEIVPKKTALPKKPAVVSETKPAKPEDSQPIPVEKEPQPSKPQPTASVAQKEKGPDTSSSTPMPKATAPTQQTPPAPIPAPSAPGMKPLPMPEKVPGDAAPMLVGIMAAFGVFFFVMVIGLYIYAGLCLFLIAKKLDVPAPWTAWIPLVNLWTLVACAGKPAWWLVLCFIPLVNAFVFIYLYMCITENLGKDKWLGLLMLVPVVNLIFLGWLAFSKSESPGSPVME